LGSKCQEGKYGCKYSGDLDETCPKYRQGSTENGEPVIASREFPTHCRNCEHRDFDFCLLYKDLICFNGQDPFDCKADLLGDRVFGLELLQKTRAVAKNAFQKRGIPFKEDWKEKE